MTVWIVSAQQLVLRTTTPLPISPVLPVTLPNSACPVNTWGDPISGLCVSTCPNNTYYVNASIPICVTICPANYYAYPINRRCYSGGSCPTTPVAYFADDTTNLCVLSCPSGYFADTFTGRCLIYCSSGFFAYAANKSCVSNCPAGEYRSSVTRSCVRNCTTGYYSDANSGNCLTICPSGTFGDATTGACVLSCSGTNYGDPSVRLCVSASGCSIGLYANNYTQTCLAALNCSSNTVGDPTTKKCVTPQSNTIHIKIVLDLLICSLISPIKYALRVVLVPPGVTPWVEPAWVAVPGTQLLMSPGPTTILVNASPNVPPIPSASQTTSQELV
jgi:hypothetical protein